MRPAILSGIVTWDVPVSYWPIFSHAPLRKLTRPRLLFVSIVTNCNLMALIDRLDHSSHNENFTFYQNCPARSVKS